MGLLLIPVFLPSGQQKKQLPIYSNMMCILYTSANLLLHLEKIFKNFSPLTTRE